METTSTEQIIGMVVGAIGFIATMFARFQQTNPDLSVFVRIARVFDLSQVVDSTRRLDD